MGNRAGSDVDDPIEVIEGDVVDRRERCHLRMVPCQRALARLGYPPGPIYLNLIPRSQAPGAFPESAPQAPLDRHFVTSTPSRHGPAYARAASHAIDRVDLHSTLCDRFGWPVNCHAEDHENIATRQRSLDRLSGHSPKQPDLIRNF